MRTLYWLTRDLRLHDNAALLAASRSQQLLLVYVVDPRWFVADQFQCRPVGDHRWRFLWQTLTNLERELRTLGQRIHIAFDKPERLIPELVRQHGIEQVIRSRQPGTDEAAQWQLLKDALPGISFHQYETLGLFTQGSLPMALSELPDTFSQFRKQIEKSGQRTGDALRIRTPGSLPPAPGFPEDNRGDCPPIPKPQHTESITGGEAAGLARLNDYLFVHHHVASYKETRNALDDPTAYSGLSSWLANGSLSAREVSETLANYEQVHVKNDSTYWLWFELLWREYFLWYAFRHGANLFRRDGVQRKKRPWTFYPHRFKAWCQGNTEYPLVNAAMNQLRETGFISNRSRQIVASCLINELELDWRYGAAWFEEQLVDYDVASNYGNWQYQAGVGADPKGPRHFNLNKQSRQFDPNGEFIKRWRGESEQPVGLHLVDAADWPV